MYNMMCDITTNKFLKNSAQTFKHTQTQNLIFLNKKKSIYHLIPRNVRLEV